MANIKVRYLIARKQKNHTIYYWSPKKCYEPQFLRMPLGNDLTQAIIKAQTFNKELDAWRKSGVDPNLVREDTLKWLTEKYKESHWFKKLSPKTQTGYRQSIVRINNWGGNYMVKSITRRACKEFYNGIHSISSANAIMRVLKLVFSFALEEGRVNENPVKGVRLIGLASRDQVWSDEEIKAVIDHCIKEKRRSIAVAIRIAQFVGQRQGDILRMTWRQYDGHNIKLKQSKTGKELSIPCHPQLKRDLDALDKTSTHIVVNEGTGQPYKEFTFRHLVGDMIRSAEVKDRWFLDLRRTAAVRLAEAGCTSEEITAITGHSIEKGSNILETYIPRSSTMAGNAVRKLQEHQEAKLKAKDEREE